MFLPSEEEEFLSQADALIDERLRTDGCHELHRRYEDMLIGACRHLCISNHAKRARPLLCLFFNRLFAEHVSMDLLPIAVAAEFIHAASLLHDDIVDNAERRRGKASANHRFGNAVAVLAGDFLLTEAFDLLRPFDRAITDRAVMVIQGMTRAAIMELMSRGQPDIDQIILRSIAIGKTGILFSWCGFAVSHLLKRPLDASLLWKVGERIGVIFQLADDLKDFGGDNNLKDRFRDLKNFEPSMPMILAMKKNASFKRDVLQMFSGERLYEEQLASIKKDIISSGAVEDAKKLMSDEFAQVRDMLNGFNGTTGKARLEAFLSSLIAITV